MVKRIRVRSSQETKAATTENTENEIVEAGDEGALTASNANQDDVVEAAYENKTEADLEAEIQKELESVAQKDDFSAWGSNLFLNVVNQWKVWAGLAVMSVLAAGIYQINTTQSLNTKVKALDEFKALQQEAQAQLVLNQIYARNQINALENPNPDAPVSDFGKLPASTDLEQIEKKFAAFADDYQGDQIEVPALLNQAQLAYQKAQGKIEELNQVASLYADIAAKSQLDPFVRAIAVQNQAVCFENAAVLASADIQAGFWTKASTAWAQLEKIDAGIYGLYAKINQARVLEAKGDLAQAKTLYQTIQTQNKADLDKPENRNYAQQVKIALARL
jgi:hypothetical protein